MRQAKIEVQTGAFFSMKDRPESALDKGFSEVLQFAYCKILHSDREFLRDFPAPKTLIKPVIPKERVCSEGPYEGGETCLRTHMKQEPSRIAISRQLHVKRIHFIGAEVAA